jgi:hypothetical protein
MPGFFFTAAGSNALYQTWQAFCLTMGWPGLQPHAF